MARRVEDTISVRCTVNTGDGTDESVKFEVGTTAREVFNELVGGNINEYRIRVNRIEPASLDVELASGDWVTVGPRKVAGAIA